MRCVYCQNHQISQDYRAQRRNEIETSVLAGHFLQLQELGCHNINLVSPTHFVPQIVHALLEAVPLGLKLPLVYNTSSYDSLDTLRELDGVVDIYLADLRYASNKWARRFSQAPDYVERSRAAIKEMHRQVGELETDEQGVARRGLIVRHLVLPNGIAGSKESLEWLARETSPRVALSLMSQYFPAHRARRHPRLARPITLEEYEEVSQLVDELGIENGWRQGMGSSRHYLPDFDDETGPGPVREDRER
jgi:putative pyruvate formate lyase activating enzyme